MIQLFYVKTDNIGLKTLYLKLKRVLNFVEAGDLTDVTTAGDEGRSLGQDLGNSFINLFRSDLVNFSAVLLNSDISEDLDVLDGFFDSVGLSFHGSEAVALKGVLGSLEFFRSDGLGEGSQLFSGGFKDLLSVAGSTADVDTEDTGVGEVEVKGMGGINEGVLAGKVFVKSGVNSLSVSILGVREGLSEEAVDNIQGNHVAVLPVDGFEDKGELNVVAFSKSSGITTYVGTLLSLLGVTINSRDETKFALNEFNKLAVVLNTSSTNEDSARVDVVKLEFLENVSVKVVNVASVTREGHTEALSVVGNLHN